MSGWNSWKNGRNGIYGRALETKTYKIGDRKYMEKFKRVQEDVKTVYNVL